MKSSDAQIKSRGKINDEDLQQYRNNTQIELVEMLKLKEANKRTIAVKILSEKHDLTDDLIRVFLQALKHEKKLYTKIELCEALSKGNIQAAKIMVEYLGQIGNNQHTQLPTNSFKKKSYPLPRDIVARTLAHMKANSLPVLVDVLKTNHIVAMREAVDAIGFICFYNNIHCHPQMIDELIQCLKNNENDAILRWKLVRALESFNDSTVINLLKEIKGSDRELVIRNEAERSLKIINSRTKK